MSIDLGNTVKRLAADESKAKTYDLGTVRKSTKLIPEPNEKLLYSLLLNQAQRTMTLVL